MLFNLYGPVKQCVEYTSSNASFDVENMSEGKTIRFDENGKQIIELKNGATIQYDEQGYRICEAVPSITFAGNQEGYDTANYVYWNNFLLEIKRIMQMEPPGFATLV